MQKNKSMPAIQAVDDSTGIVARSTLHTGRFTRSGPKPEKNRIAIWQFLGTYTLTDPKKALNNDEGQNNSGLLLIMMVSYLLG